MRLSEDVCSANEMSCLWMFWVYKQNKAMDLVLRGGSSCVATLVTMICYDKNELTSLFLFAVIDGSGRTTVCAKM